MQLAIVGPTGVLGRALIPILVEQGHRVRALARSTAEASRLFPQGVEIIECDLLAPDIVEHLPIMLKGCDAVAHIATSIPRDSTAPNAWEANTRLRTVGVKVLLKAALEAGVRSYVQQSITMAYPDHRDEWINETMPLDSSAERASVCGPVIAMEQMLSALAPVQLNWCILRGGSFVGPRTFQARTIDHLRAGTQRVACDGRNFVSLVHVADMANAVALALVHTPVASILNIADEPMREGDYLDQLAAAIGAERPQRDEAAQCPPSWRCSNQAAKSMLGWMPLQSVIPEGLSL